MLNKSRTYTQEFKDAAVNLALELGSVTKAARQLGINETNIRDWKKKRDQEQALKTSDPQGSLSELERLRRENAELRKVNHILKAAAAVFCQDQFK